MTRPRLRLDGTPPLDTMVSDRRGTAFRLFEVHEAAASSDDVSIRYHGRTYVVSPGRDAQDDQLEVLPFLNDLIALQSSAKSCPTPNVIFVADP